MSVFESGLWDRVENVFKHDVLPAIRQEIVPAVKAAVSDVASQGAHVVKAELYRGLTEGRDLSTALYDAAYSGVTAAKVKIKDKIADKIYHNVDLPFVEISGDTIPNKTEEAIDKRLEMKVDGRDREYLLHVPPGYDRSKPMPLVVVLHGMNENDKDIAAMTKMSEKADKEGFIVAYPNATKWLGTNSWQAWDTKNGILPPSTSSDDVGFVGRMIDSISDQVGVDKSRVYVTGFSNGGMLAHRIATDLSDKVAAVAIVGGAMSGLESQPKSPISVMTLNGSDDCIVPSSGLESCENLQKIGIPNFQPSTYTYDFWTKANGASTTTNEENSDVKVQRSVNEDTNTEVVAYTIVGGKHEWPGSDRAQKNPNQADAKFAATDTIWEFFARHKKAPN